MLGHCGSHPWGQLPYSPRGMTAGRCANAPAGGGLTGGWVCPTPPVGSKKGGRLCFLGGRVPVEPLVQALPYPHGFDSPFCLGVSRQMVPCKEGRPFVLVTWLLFCAWVNKGRVPVEPCSVALPKDHLCPIGVAPHTIGQV